MNGNLPRAFALLLAILVAGKADCAEPAQTSKPKTTAPTAVAATTAKPAAEQVAAAHTKTLRGKVVWLADALRKRYGIETDANAVHDIAALDANDGELYPLVRDTRGRGFWLDQRLRDRDLELFVRQYPGSPTIQVIRVYTHRPAGKYELDYWCDICAIPMYELKACECCQGGTRLRERRVAAGAETGTDGDEPDDPISEPAPPLSGLPDKPA